MLLSTTCWLFSHPLFYPTLRLRIQFLNVMLALIICQFRFLKNIIIDADWRFKSQSFGVAYYFASNKFDCFPSIAAFGGLTQMDFLKRNFRDESESFPLETIERFLLNLQQFPYFTTRAMKALKLFTDDDENISLSISRCSWLN